MSVFIRLRDSSQEQKLVEAMENRGIGDLLNELGGGEISFSVSHKHSPKTPGPIETAAVEEAQPVKARNMFDEHHVWELQQDGSLQPGMTPPRPDILTMLTKKAKAHGCSISVTVTPQAMPY